MTRTRIAAALGATGLAAGLIFAPSAFAADPTPVIPNPQCADLNGHKVDCSLIGSHVIVDTADGALAGVRVNNTLCLRVEALSHEKTADVRLRVPCPNPVHNCVEAAKHGYHDVPATDPRYRHYLDPNHDGIACKTQPVTPPVTPAPEAPAPEIVQSHLPVTH